MPYNFALKRLLRFLLILVPVNRYQLYSIHLSLAQDEPIVGLREVVA